MKRVIGVFAGEPAIAVGELHFIADRGKEASSFRYLDAWLARKDVYALDPSLPLVAGHQFARREGSAFPGAIADAEPDGWERKVIQRDRAKRGLAAAATALDFLLDVHDESRTGTIRFSEGGESFLATPAPGKRTAPPLVDLKDLQRAAAAIERGDESAADLRMLLDRGSPLGGMRPKCTVMDNEGFLSIGKFPSATDQRDVVRGEALALALASAAGIRAAHAQVVLADGTPVIVIRRFDRIGKERLHYLSARSMLEAGSGDDYTYTDIAAAIREHGQSPNLDVEELWRRVVFSVLVTNTDDHLNNHGFLQAAPGTWRLSPAFDLNPNPERARTFKTWISPDAGPEASIELAMSALKPFGIALTRGKQILADIERVVAEWHARARSLGMKDADIQVYEATFEHAERAAARRALAPAVPVAPLPATKSRRKP